MTTQPIEKPFTEIDVKLDIHPLIIKRSLKYTKIPNFFVPDKAINFRNYFEKETKTLWFHFSDVCFVAARKNKPDLSTFLSKDHYKTFEIVQINGKHKVETFVDLVGLLLLLNKAAKDIRDYYMTQISIEVIMPYINKPVRKRKKKTDSSESE